VKNSFRAALLLSALLFLTVGIASADTLITYQFTGAISASFELPVNPTPIGFTLGFNFIVMPVDLMINGAPSADRLNFYSSSNQGGGGFAAVSNTGVVDINTAGPQLYTGPENAPTMLGVVTGGVTLTNYDPTGAIGPPAGTITSPGTPGPVGSVTTPEPSATVLLGIGLLAVGLAVLGFKPKFAITAN
jgi:hypothetical protein